jgi:hypothetical protein
MEYKTFENEHLQPYTGAKKQLLADYQETNALLDDGMWRDSDGNLTPIDLKTPEGRAMAYRKRNEVTMRFYNMSAEQDMNLANEAAKYEANPIIHGRVLGIIKTGSDMLQNVAHPPNIETEATAATMQYQDRMATTAEEDTKNRKEALKQEKETKEPTDIPQAIRSPLVGPQQVLQWLTTGAGREILLSNAGVPFTNQARLEIRQQLLASGNYKDDGPEGVETLKLEAELDRLGPEALNIAAVRMLRQVDPQAAEAAKIYSPQYFEWEKTDQEKQAPSGILGDKRRSKAQLVEQIDVWKPAVDAQLQRIMEDPRASTDPEAAISAIVDQWLPGALVGREQNSGVPSQYVYAETAATAEERRALTEKLREHLRKTWHKNPLAAEANPDRVGTPGVLSLRSRRLQERNKRKGLVEE